MTDEMKYKKNMRCLDNWMSNKENGKWIADYLSAHQICRIGIYGYGILGKHLVRELQERDFSISWVMDRSSFGNEQCSNIVRPDDADTLEKVDMAIITSLSAVEEAETVLLGFVKGNIISIEELVGTIYAWGNQN